MPGDDQLSQLFNELCAVLLPSIRTPSIAFPPAAAGRPHVAARRRARARMSPAGFASLLLGASLALMLCGSVTFVIGFFMMPWVIGFVMFFYFVGIVSNLSGMGRAFFCPGRGSPNTPRRCQSHFFQIFHSFNKEADG